MNKNDFKEEIIATGRKLFAYHGYKKTSMNDVARKLNRVKGSLYYYFKSKDELLTAIVRFDAGDWQLCREAEGSRWYDWANYTKGKHNIIARVCDDKGTVLEKSAAMRCKSI